MGVLGRRRRGYRRWGGYSDGGFLPGMILGTMMGSGRRGWGGSLAAAVGAVAASAAGTAALAAGAAVRSAAVERRKLVSVVGMSEHRLDQMPRFTDMRTRAAVAPVLIATIAVVALFALIIGGCAVSGYNRAISLSEQVDQRWAQVEVVLQRRYDLVPNLVETVKGYAGHEREIFTEIAHAREKYFQAQNTGKRDEQVEAANGMERALSRLLLLQERYPELRAQASFQDLMTQLEGTENRIAVERQRYTESVRELNTFVRGFPGKIYAAWAGVTKAEQFEVAGAEVRQAPRVDFGTTQPAP